MELKRVVVTGLGALTPIGNTVSAFWDSLIKGVSGAAPITRFDASKFKTRFACEVKGFSADNFMERKEARKVDPFVHYALAVVDEAVADASLEFEKLDTNRIGVIWGSGIGGLKTFLDEVISFGQGDGTPRFNPFFIPKMILDIAPGHISMRYGLHGLNFSTVSACASSTHALIDSLNYIRTGYADVIISGGSEAIINEAGIGGFNAMHALSTRNDDPTTASRPFDKDRDGFVAGEGAGAIILESLEHAKARGAKIYAELVGGGMSADAHHITASHPEGLGARLAMANAIKDAKISKENIDYINVHGTSTPVGDISESKAILDFYGDHAYDLSISSTKSMTGHLLGAAGAVESIASILAVRNDMAPPTINHFTDDPNLDQKLNFTFNKAQKRKIDAAMSNTFGFGGHNATVIFKKFEE
ncbi:beta-ketoacyl-ACP synthase II [Parapedobacter tibetensis]|uniref:beta-ketoacyl-ACP synthase II n=1 Tax=Parapedobacter tibetensis TaxID=2972951 RepID=UPI00214D5EE4|nr:beta-ketoacyl-ACP synthase II [Parapedobacter tibetensis]